MTTSATPLSPTKSYPVHYRTVAISGQEVFYREAGPADAPVMLLLHGFPTSSNMFRNLITKLVPNFRVIAPDYIGYGLSSMPDPKEFAYTFENQTNFIEKLMKNLGLTRFFMYVMDYGAPIGYRLALRWPEKVAGFVIQNGNAYDGGLLEFWDPIKKYWNEHSAESEAGIAHLVKLEATKWQYQNGVSDTSLLDPSAWMLDQYGLDRPDNDRVQLDMFYDYRTNVPFYPEFQEFFRKYQPPTLIVWGQNDFIFPPPGAEAYKQDLKNLEIYMFPTGHFALETHCDEIADHINRFFHK